MADPQRPAPTHGHATAGRPDHLIGGRRNEAARVLVVHDVDAQVAGRHAREVEHEPRREVHVQELVEAVLQVHGGREEGSPIIR